MRAYDLSRYQRLIAVEGGLVTGTFWVLGALSKRDDFHVKPLEVTVWDSAEHRTGRVLYSPDLTAFVKDGKVDIPPHMINSNKHADVLDAMADMEAAILAACEVFAAENNEREEKP